MSIVVFSPLQSQSNYKCSLNSHLNGLLITGSMVFDPIANMCVTPPGQASRVLFASPLPGVIYEFILASLTIIKSFQQSNAQKGAHEAKLVGVYYFA